MRSYILLLGVLLPLGCAEIHVLRLQALVIPPIIVTLVQVVLALKDETAVFGLPYFKMVIFFIFVGMGGIVHLLHDVQRYGWRGMYHRITRTRFGEYEATSLFAPEDGGHDRSNRSSPHTERNAGSTFRTIKG
jgi:hypothetical protein